MCVSSTAVRLEPLCTAAIILVLMGILDALRLTPFPNIDLEPFAFTFAALILTWGLFRLQIGDIVPVAQASIIERMADGIIVLNAEGRILDLNPMAQDLLGLSDVEYVGDSMAQISVSPGRTCCNGLRRRTEDAIQEVALGNTRAGPSMCELRCCGMDEIPSLDVLSCCGM